MPRNEPLRWLIHHGHPIAEVDVIVPCYRSERHLPKLLASFPWRGETPVNLFLVVDGDGYDPSEAVSKHVPDEVCVRAIAYDENRGFAPAVNAGVALGRASYLLLLNADIMVPAHHDFLTPLQNELRENLDVAAAGGLQLDPRGRIHSCGSEYVRANRCYDHVLRGQPATTDDRYLREPGDRDVLTGSCLLVRRAGWDRVGGLDEGYRIGYFEDADLCLALRRAGYRIRYVPDSVVVHECGHSGASRHIHYEENRQRFLDRWVQPGWVDRFARQRGRRSHGGEIVAGMIVLNEEEYVAASLASIYDLVDRIVVVEGGVDAACQAGLCGADGASVDRTAEIVQAFPDPDGKITLRRGRWPDKLAMRNAYAETLRPGDWLWVIDGDEIMLEESKGTLLAAMHDAEAVNFPVLTFWNDFDTVATGLWETFQPPRCIRWEEGTRYGDHVTVLRADGRPAGRPGDKGTHLLAEPVLAHYAYVKPVEKIRRKIDYYRGTTGRIRGDYVDTVFLRFREDPTVVERIGSHPFGGGGTAPFLGHHPDAIRVGLESGRLGGEGW